MRSRRSVAKITSVVLPRHVAAGRPPRHEVARPGRTAPRRAVARRGGAGRPHGGSRHAAHPGRGAAEPCMTPGRAAGRALAPRSAASASLAGVSETSLPSFVDWDSFPFEGRLRLKKLEDPVEVEPPRVGEDPADCPKCKAPDDAYIWVNENWRVRSLDRPSGLPMVLILESRSHLDLGDLPNMLAAELGVMTVRLERAIRSLDGVARVHVNRWGDGAAHLHVWFMARPYGRLQLRGPFLTLWDEVLPPIPEEKWRENLAMVAAWLSRSPSRPRSPGRLRPRCRLTTSSRRLWLPWVSRTPTGSRASRRRPATGKPGRPSTARGSPTGPGRPAGRRPTARTRGTARRARRPVESRPTGSGAGRRPRTPAHRRPHAAGLFPRSRCDRRRAAVATRRATTRRVTTLHGCRWMLRDRTAGPRLPAGRPARPAPGRRGTGAPPG